MRQFELSDEKIMILCEILTNHLSEIRTELANTDQKDFRDYLQKRIDFLEEFIGGLKGKTQSGSERPATPLCPSGYCVEFCG